MGQDVGTYGGLVRINRNSEIQGPWHEDEDGAQDVHDLGKGDALDVLRREAEDLSKNIQAVTSGKPDARCRRTEEVVDELGTRCAENMRTIAHISEPTLCHACTALVVPKGIAT